MLRPTKRRHQVLRVIAAQKRASLDGLAKIMHRTPQGLYHTVRALRSLNWITTVTAQKKRPRRFQVTEVGRKQLGSNSS